MPARHQRHEGHAEQPETPEMPEQPTPEQPEQPTPEQPTPQPSTDLDLDFLATGGMMLAEALASETQPVRARSDRQQVMDVKVKALHSAWVDKNKPGDWNALVKAGVVATYFVEPDKSARFKQYVNRAALLHGVRVRWGSSFVVTKQHIEKFNLPAEFEGREAIAFAILDKRPRPASTNGQQPTEVRQPETANA
jgi:hypothetical protein